MNTFQAWLAKAFADGMTDIKFAITPGKGVSVEAIENELLACEAAISAGLVKVAPVATSMVPKTVTDFVASIT